MKFPRTRRIFSPHESAELHFSSAIKRRSSFTRRRGAIFSSPLMKEPRSRPHRERPQFPQSQESRRVPCCPDSNHRPCHEIDVGPETTRANASKPKQSFTGISIPRPSGHLTPVPPLGAQGLCLYQKMSNTSLQQYNRYTSRG